MSIILDETSLNTGQRLQLVQGDITVETTDAIVNAANKNLRHGGGVAGAILRCGGNKIQEESDRWVQINGPVTHDKPAWTSSGNLKTKFIIHAVGPVWGEGQEENKLASAVNGSLRVADELDLRSVSMPAISTGIYGFPLDAAARIIITSTCIYLKINPTKIDLVRIVLRDDLAVQIFRSAWQANFGDETPEPET